MARSSHVLLSTLFSIHWTELKVTKEIWDSEGKKLLRVEEAEPECGVAFCDACGDCLACYGSDPCFRSADGEHRWVVYEETKI